MRKLKKAVTAKNPELESAERNEYGVILHPRFYFKKVGGKITVEHLLTQTYLGTFDSEEELVEYMAELSQWDDYALYTYLMRERHASNVYIASRKMYYREDEMYLTAWGQYTAQFYERYPQYFQLENDFPRDTIKKIAAEIRDEQIEEHKRHLEIIKERERNSKARIEAEEKAAKAKKEEKVEEKPKKKIRRLKKVKRKGTSLNIVEVQTKSSNPFD